MRETSDFYKRLLADPAHVKESRLTIGGVIYDESQIVSLSTTEPLFAEDTMSIGGALAREIDFSAFLADDVPKRAQIIHEVRLKTDTEVSEWLQKGVYYINTRSKDPLTGVTTVHGFDAMLMAEQEWIPPAKDEFPMSMKEAVELTAAALGLEIDPRTMFKTGDAYKVDYPVASADESEEQQTLGLSIRQMWRWVAAAHGGNFIINDLGHLRLVPLNALPGNTGYLVTETGRAITFGGKRIMVGQSTSGSAVISNDKVYVGGQMAGAEQIPAFLPISRIALKVSDSAAYVSESDTEGLTLETSCAYGSQQIADDLLLQLKGYAYQPVQAEDALIDPAAELGDGLTVNGVYTILAQKDTIWDMLSAADIGAPGKAELENEFNFTPTQDAEYRYELAKTLSLIAKSADEIRLKVESEINGAKAEFSVALKGLDATVESYEKTVAGYTKQVAQYAAAADGYSANLKLYSDEVGGYKEQTASYAAALEGFTASMERYAKSVDGYTEQTAGYALALEGYSGEVKSYKETVDGYTEQVISFNGTVAGYTQTVASYQKTVAGYTEQYSAISQKVDGISLEVTDENGKVSIQLKSGENDLGTAGTIDMTGLVTFTALSGAPGEGTKGSINGGWIDADTLTVNAANINGKLNVDKISMKGNISWDFLDATTQKAIQDAAKSGGHTDGEIRTLINKKLVSSPTIAGGVFQDEPEDPDAALYLDREYDDDEELVNAGVVLERRTYYYDRYGKKEKRKRTLQTLQIWDDGLDGVALSSRKNMFLHLTGGQEMRAYGMWTFYGTVDFSKADVIGL